MLIRRIVPTDAEEWLRMRLALWPEHNSEEHREEMETIRFDPNCAVFVAQREDGGLGGFLEAAQRKYAEGCNSSPVGYIEGWYVDPDQRRQGVGVLLARMAENWVRQCGLVEMASDCQIDNQISIMAHQEIGYQEVERLVHFCKRL